MSYLLVVGLMTNNTALKKTQIIKSQLKHKDERGAVGENTNIRKD